jgi:hypothetical protein
MRPSASAASALNSVGAASPRRAAGQKLQRWQGADIGGSGRRARGVLGAVVIQVAQSVVGAIAIGAILALNHRPGHYLVV